MDKNTAPPPELSLFWHCQRFPGALPEAGAILDQDYGLMTRMAALDGIYKAFDAYRGATGKRIHDLPSWVLANIAYLKEIGVNIGMAK